MSKTWKIIKIIFYSAIIIGSLFVITTSLNLFGFQMFVVKSGSMEPEIKTGSLVIDRTSTDYRIKDVITFKVSDSKETVTHRIIDENIKDGVTSYQVKGDANATPDPDPVLKTNVVGKVLFSIPFLGYLIAFIRSLPGLILFIILPTLIIVSEEIGKIKIEIKKLMNSRKDFDKKLAELEKREADLEVREERLRAVIRNMKKKIPKG